MLVSIESVLMQGGLWGASQTHTLQALQGLCQLCSSGRTLAKTMPTLTELRQRLDRLEQASEVG